jgi:hypothetical protein
MGKGELGRGEMRAGVGWWEVSKYKNKPVSSNAAMEIFFQSQEFFC